VNRTLPGSAGDVALVLARLILGTIMFAHGYQKLFIDGLGRTTKGFEYMSILSGSRSRPQCLISGFRLTSRTR
jgi:uncharacterized membrane protein YphA (DoxX/SURF4 family)